jgi:hypothetical protein
MATMAKHAKSPETWTIDAYQDERGNRIIAKVKADGRRAWTPIATVRLEDHDTPEDVYATLAAAVDDAGDAGKVRLELWGTGKIPVSQMLWHDDADDDDDDDADGRMPRSYAERDRDRYIAQLHKNNLALLKALPDAVGKVLDASATTLKMLSDDRQRWMETTIALLEHGDAGKDTGVSSRLKVLAREDLHHGMRALMSAASARIAGVPAGDEVTRVLAELGRSLEPTQLETLAKALRPEQAQALLQLLAAAQDADVQTPAPAPA